MIAEKTLSESCWGTTARLRVDEGGKDLCIQAGIALTRYEFEAAPILEAASQSIKLWENVT